LGLPAEFARKIRAWIDLVKFRSGVPWRAVTLVLPLTKRVEVMIRALVDPIPGFAYSIGRNVEQHDAAHRRDCWTCVRTTGWVYEANGCFTRGSEYDVQFVVDGAAKQNALRRLHLV